jgi:hypothetical protein
MSNKARIETARGLYVNLATAQVRLGQLPPPLTIPRDDILHTIWWLRYADVSVAMVMCPGLIDTQDETARLVGIWSLFAGIVANDMMDCEADSYSLGTMNMVLLSKAAGLETCWMAERDTALGLFTDCLQNELQDLFIWQWMDSICFTLLTPRYNIYFHDSRGLATGAARGQALFAEYVGIRRIMGPAATMATLSELYDTREDNWAATVYRASERLNCQASIDFKISYANLRSGGEIGESCRMLVQLAQQNLSCQGDYRSACIVLWPALKFCGLTDNAGVWELLNV